jgi:signal transduction histidine kinase/CheY-like chemotaxis protein
MNAPNQSAINNSGLFVTRAMANDGELSERVARERIRLVYRHLPAAVVLPILAAALIAYVLRDLLPHSRLWLWVAWVTACYAILPASLYLAYRNAAGPAPDARVWGKRYVIMAFFTAMSWGAAGVLLYVPDLPLYQIFLGGMLFTSAASVLVTTFAYTPGYYAGIIPILLPLAVRFAAAGGALDIALAGMIILSFLMFSYFQHSLHKGLSESLSLRFEREALADELASKNLEIEKASRAKSRFLAAASHDLRQPMHAQRLFLAELDARLSDPQDKAVASHIRESMRSMGDMLDGFLDISEIDAGTVKPNSRAFPLLPMLDRLHNEFAGLMAQKGLRYRVAQCRHAVHSDPALLERILRNLVHNALRYTSSGAVLVACRRCNRMLEIQIRDSGPGIPQEKQQQIFEEFTQLDNPERQREKGLGLGLAIVARLAQLLGHAIELRSRPGTGSTFLVRVPLADESVQAQAETGLSRSPGNALAGLRVLVIEDDRVILTAIAMLLNRWQCNALMAGDGGEAVRIARDTDAAPDVIIADYRLPGEATGIEVVKSIRALSNAPIPAVLITGDTASMVLREAQMNHCILMHKPLDTETLYALLCNLCRC